VIGLLISEEPSEAVGEKGLVDVVRGLAGPPGEVGRHLALLPPVAVQVQPGAHQA
jgi:hypothetical protein